MMDSFRRWTALGSVVLCALLAVLSAAPVATAHEHVIVMNYELIVGWRVEPAVAGLLNGLDLGIQHHLTNGTTAWVTGAEGNLSGALRFGTASLAKALQPQSGRPGWYTFDVIPTREGIYSVWLRGRVDATPVNVTVNLDAVSPASAVEFPATDPTAAQLALENAGLRIQMFVATGIGIAGLAVGLVALAWMARARRGGRDTP